MVHRHPRDRPALPQQRSPLQPNSRQTVAGACCRAPAGNTNGVTVRISCPARAKTACAAPPPRSHRPSAPSSARRRTPRWGAPGPPSPSPTGRARAAREPIAATLWVAACDAAGHPGRDPRRDRTATLGTQPAPSSAPGFGGTRCTARPTLPARRASGVLASGAHHPRRNRPNCRPLHGDATQRPGIARGTTNHGPAGPLPTHDYP